MQSKQSRSLTIDQYIMHLVRKKNPETVEQLLKLVQLKYSISEQEIMEHIIHLQNQGKLILKEQQPTSSSATKGYLLSAQATWYWIIVILALATTTAVFTIPEETLPIVYARYMLGSAFVLFLPGYSFIKALFPRKELDNVELVALSLGMSLALVPITGLVLSYTPWGITTTPVVLSLLALTVTFATAALIRENKAKIQQNT